MIHPVDNHDIPGRPRSASGAESLVTFRPLATQSGHLPAFPVRRGPTDRVRGLDPSSTVPQDKHSVIIGLEVPTVALQIAVETFTDVPSVAIRSTERSPAPSNEG